MFARWSKVPIWQDTVAAAIADPFGHRRLSDGSGYSMQGSFEIPVQLRHYRTTIVEYVRFSVQWYYLYNVDCILFLDIRGHGDLCEHYHVMSPIFMFSHTLSPNFTPNLNLIFYDFLRKWHFFATFHFLSVIHEKNVIGCGARCRYLGSSHILTCLLCEVS